MHDTKDHNKLLPGGSFITCSSDNTIRIWNYDTHSSSDKSTRKVNFYSNVCFTNSRKYSCSFSIDCSILCDYFSVMLTIVLSRKHVSFIIYLIYHLHTDLHNVT